MSKETNLFEQIELYLTDQLSESERTQFVSQLQQDPLLKEELQFQNDIIQSIRNNRKVQLKSRLDNIQLPGPGIGESTVSGLKLAGSILAIATVGVGTYFYLQEPDAVPEVTPPIEQITQEPETVVPVEVDQVETSPIIEQETKQEADQQIAETVEQTTAPEAEPIPEPPAQRVQPNLIELPADEELGSTTEMVDLPGLPAGSEDLNEVPEMAVKKIQDGKHNFHYQYYNDKLYLYGDFQNIPYEILDLAGSESRKLYLFYMGNFYYIRSDQSEISPLEVITDAHLVNELNILRVSKDR